MAQKRSVGLLFAFILLVCLSGLLVPAEAQTTPPPPATPLADSLVLTTNYTTIQSGTALTLTATVTPAVLPVMGVEATPTGSVSFYDGTTLLGTSTLYPVGVGSYASMTTLTTSTLPGGQDTLTAKYLGDTFYATAASNAVTVAVQDFSITPAATNPAENLNINQGSAGSASFVVGGMGGFTGQVQVVCAVPQQDNMTCTATPQQVAPGGTVTFIVKTFANGAVAHREAPKPLWPRAVGSTALAVLGFFLVPFSRRATSLLRRAADPSIGRAFILLLLLVGLASAGIGCTSGGTIATTGTPLGVATLKITATANVDNTVVSHSVYLTVDVLPPGVTAP